MGKMGRGSPACSDPKVWEICIARVAIGEEAQKVLAGHMVAWGAGEQKVWLGEEGKD